MTVLVTPEVLENILIYLEDGDLHLCKDVCRIWEMEASRVLLMRWERVLKEFNKQQTEKNIITPINNCKIREASCNMQ